jgi:NitT/TauT family transport system substrate-binding protein
VSLRRSSFLAGSATALLVPTQLRAADPLSVAIIPGDASASAYYAQQLGLFKNAGLDVNLQIIATGPTIASAVVGGTIDIGAVNTGSLALARMRGVALRALAPANIIGFGPTADTILVTKTSTMRNGDDLRGKTIAINSVGTVQHAAALAWIDAHGGDAKSVKFIELPVPAMPAAIDAGRVDGGICGEPYVSQAAATTRGLGPIYDAMHRPFLLFALCAGERWLANNPATAQQFASVIRQANLWANARENDAQRRQFNATLSKMDPQIIAKMTLAEMGTTLDATVIQPVIDVMVKYGFMEHRVNPDDLIWRST